MTDAARRRVWHVCGTAVQAVCPLEPELRCRHHGSVDRMDYEQISECLRGLLVRLDDRMSVKDLVLIAEFVDVGELGLALEQMADVLSEEDLAVSDDERTDMLALADRMKISNRIRRALEFCPQLES